MAEAGLLDAEKEQVARRGACLTAQQIRALMMLKVSSRAQAAIAATRLDGGGREG